MDDQSPQQIQTSSSDPFSQALAALGRKERSVAEMTEWLRARGLSEDEVETVVSRLTSIRMLDDARFARRYAEDKRSLQAWGTDRIRAALIERGVSRDQIEEVLGDAGGEPEIERAVTLLRRRGTPLTEPQQRQRALGLLARRGYDAEVAYEAIRRAGRA